MELVIMGVFFLVAILGAIFGPRAWDRWKEKIARRDPVNGLIYRRQGDEIVKIEGRQAWTNDKGETWIYKDGRKSRSLLLPRDYPVRYIVGLRMILCNIGDPVAVTSWDQAHSGFSQDDIDNLVASNLAEKLVASVTSKASAFNWKWLAIGALVLVVAWFGWQKYQENQVVPAPVPPVNGAVNPSLPPGAVVDGVVTPGGK